ncbi:MAG: UDP-N-acetylmuramoyl-L-alanine--D-glutamate ligase [Candidatus Nomurabacteria bacterium]|jgi:UDP-N-acetylmuramoylalanine--D-glutamate ligase|nr:UDP-N-acetylmuramoyl-L-alanine--D-glutamate ligase [Candidatus Nomurabacteria bacterium]
MRVAILGYGIEGQSAYRYFSGLGKDYEVEVFDEQAVLDGVVKITTVKDFAEIDFSKYDIIVRSPSVRPDEILAVLPTDGRTRPSGRFGAMRRHDQSFSDEPRYDGREERPRIGQTARPAVTSATQIFFDNCPAPIIGVTGTKGKGSTASFIADILRAGGVTVHLVGNIGVPALDELPKISADDVVVYELSSFQLWDLTKSPQVAVLTIIEPDHLNVHKDMAEYVAAKTNIVHHQSAKDFVIYNKLDAAVTEMAKSSKAQKLPYPQADLEKLARGAVKLAGEHQLRNAEAAILAARAVRPDLTDVEVRAGLAAFDGLPHRLKFVAEKAGVKYYDDSIATTPGSAIASIEAFKEPKILILGGSDKGADYAEIGAAAKANNVRQIFAIGANRDKVKNQVCSEFLGEITLLDDPTMAQLVPKIAAAAQAGDVVILSPAAASFDMFKNYADRGQQFIAAVNEL